MLRSLLFLCCLYLLCDLVTSRCPNSCSGHGLCGTSNICTCFDGWNGGAPDCSFRNCPNGTAWADKAYELDKAHQSAECSNAGVCNRISGVCQCFPGFSGNACQRSACPNDCSGHGTCSTIKDVALYSGPDYDSTINNVGDGVGNAYTNWDKNSIQLCECDGGFFGSDCSQVMCPKGDDPLTINQNYRTIQLTLVCTGSYPISGVLGLQFMGETVFLDVTNPSDSLCTSSMAFKGKFGNVGCSVLSVSDFQMQFQFVFYSWPTFPKDNNFYFNDGNPSKYDFYCDESNLNSPFTYCQFSDVENSNIREYAYCSNRGLCDFTTGNCDCNEGFGGPACSNVTYLYTQGSNSLPGLLVNVNGFDYTSSALQITSEKAKSSDFNLIEAIAGSETVFSVQGDGTVNMDKLVTLQGGQTISGSGLYVKSGGVTVAGDGVFAYSLDATDPVLTVGSKYTGALGTSYAALKVFSTGSNPNTHYLIMGSNSGKMKFGVRGDGGVLIRGGGLFVTSGASVFSGGLTVSYGVTVNTGGLRIGASGISVTGGVTIGSGGLKVKDSLLVQNGGATVSSGGFVIGAGGQSINGGGLVVTSGVTVFSGGLRVTAGLSVYSGGMYITGGATIYTNGLFVVSKGITIANDGLVVTNRGATITSGGLVVNAGGLTVTNGGHFITSGGLTVSFGGLVSSGGLTVQDSGMVVVSGGLSVATSGFSVTGGVSIGDVGLAVTGGVSVTGQLFVTNTLTVTGGVTIGTGSLQVSGGVTITNGDVYTTGSMTVQTNLGVGGALLVSGGMTIYGGNFQQSTPVIFSDRRLKSKLAPITNALKKVSRLNGVYFNWVQDEPTGLSFDTDRHVGVIAQEVLEVLPEVVEPKHEGLYLGVDYASMVPLLIEAIHDLEEGMTEAQTVSTGAAEDLRKDVAQLQSDNAALSRQVSGLQSQLDELRALVSGGSGNVRRATDKGKESSSGSFFATLLQRILG